MSFFIFAKGAFLFVLLLVVSLLQWLLNFNCTKLRKNRNEEGRLSEIEGDCFATLAKSENQRILLLMHPLPSVLADGRKRFYLNKIGTQFEGG